MWWVSIEEIAPRANEIAGEKEMACCVRGYHVYMYEDMLAAVNEKVLVCRCWCVVGGKIFVVKLFLCKYFGMFSVYENIFTTKKANYSRSSVVTQVIASTLYIHCSIPSFQSSD